MKKVIVTTTINPPTEAIEKFQSMAGWELVVVVLGKGPESARHLQNAAVAHAIRVLDPVCSV